MKITDLNNLSYIFKANNDDNNVDFIHPWTVEI